MLIEILRCIKGLIRKKNGDQSVPTGYPSTTLDPTAKRERQDQPRTPVLQCIDTNSIPSIKQYSLLMKILK
jgi:hypothetical protein